MPGRTRAGSTGPTEPIKIIRMRHGEAPPTADRIYIERRPDGRASWIGAASVGRGAVFGNSLTDLPSVAEAEAEAIRWARSQGATEIIIEEPDS